MGESYYDYPGRRVAFYLYVFFNFQIATIVSRGNLYCFFQLNER